MSKKAALPRPQHKKPHYYRYGKVSYNKGRQGAADFNESLKSANQLITTLDNLIKHLQPQIEMVKINAEIKEKFKAAQDNFKTFHKNFKKQLFSGKYAKRRLNEMAWEVKKIAKGITTTQEMAIHAQRSTPKLLNDCQKDLAKMSKNLTAVNQYRFNTARAHYLEACQLKEQPPETIDWLAVWQHLKLTQQLLLIIQESQIVITKIAV